MGIGLIWPLMLGGGTLVLPESPRYAYRQGRVQEAQWVMCKLYGVPANHRCIAQEMQHMKEKLEEEKAAGVTSWHEIVTGPRMLDRTLVGVALQSLSQLTGARFILMGLRDSYVTQIILSAVDLGMTLPGLYVVEHWGRRKALMIGAGWMFICFMIWASVGHVPLDLANGQNTPHAGAMMIVFTFFFTSAPLPHGVPSFGPSAPSCILRATAPTASAWPPPPTGRGTCSSHSSRRSSPV